MLLLLLLLLHVFVTLSAENIAKIGESSPSSLRAVRQSDVSGRRRTGEQNQEKDNV